MWVCSHCKSNNQDYDLTCIECGVEAPPASPKEPSTYGKFSIASPLFFGFWVVVFYLIYGFYYVSIFLSGIALMAGGLFGIFFAFLSFRSKENVLGLACLGMLISAPISIVGLVLFVSIFTMVGP